MTLRLSFARARPHGPRCFGLARACNRALGLAAFSWLIGLNGCSLLVSPDQGTIECTVEKGDDPCPKGTQCRDGRCKSPECMRIEICADHIDNDCDNAVDERNEDLPETCDNGHDDDCDGNTDETDGKDRGCDRVDNDCDGKVDEDSDLDRDGYTTCGDDPTEFDCEAMQAKAHPGGDEVCDGLDNDCDGNTDNPQKGKPATLDCSSGQLCSDGRCVAKTCAVPKSDVTCQANERCVDDLCVPMNCAVPCTEGQFCDTTTRTCVDVPRQRKIGESCTLDADCMSGTVCIDSAALHLSEPPRRVCGMACCNDTDCGAGETCFASGTGARSCLPRTLAANANAGNAKACMVSTECASPQVCALGESTQNPSTRKLATTMCRPPGVLERAYVEQCSSSLSCNTHLCLALVFSNVCTATCRVTTDCVRLAEYNALIQIHGYCQYVDLGDYVPSAAANFAPICVAKFDAIGKAPATCKTNADCPEDTCIGASTSTPGKCAPTCCNDAQCKILRPNSRCIPVARGTNRYEMRCIE